MSHPESLKLLAGRRVRQGASEAYCCQQCFHISCFQATAVLVSNSNLFYNRLHSIQRLFSDAIPPSPPNLTPCLKKQWDTWMYCFAAPWGMAKLILSSLNCGAQRHFKGASYSSQFPSFFMFCLIKIPFGHLNWIGLRLYWFFFFNAHKIGPRFLFMGEKDITVGTPCHTPHRLTNSALHLLFHELLFLFYCRTHIFLCKAFQNFIGFPPSASHSLSFFCMLGHNKQNLWSDNTYIHASCFENSTFTSAPFFAIYLQDTKFVRAHWDFNDPAWINYGQPVHDHLGLI